MSTALDFIAQGVGFERRGGLLILACPPELLDDLNFEIALREPLVGELPPSGRREHCDTCGDRMAAGRGGLCQLCAVARARWLKARGLL